jgi:hypothetical protein
MLLMLCLKQKRKPDRYFLGMECGGYGAAADHVICIIEVRSRHGRMQEGTYVLSNLDMVLKR